MEKYVVRLIGSKLILLTILIPELQKSDSQRIENKIVARVENGAEFNLRVVTPALWETSQKPMVNHWELNQALIDIGACDASARICVAFNSDDEFYYASSPIKAAKMQDDNTLIDDILPNDLPTPNLEEQIQTSMDEEEEYQNDKDVV